MSAFVIKVEFRGTQKLRQVLSRERKALRSALAKELYREAEQIMTKAKTSRPGQGVPVDTGVLRSTGHVVPPDLSPSSTGRVRVLLGFGGPAAPYALAQHERLDYSHEIGEPKYLERPAIAAAPGMGVRISRGVRAGIVRRARGK
jgi:hypothetical protein